MDVERGLIARTITMNDMHVCVFCIYVNVLSDMEDLRRGRSSYVND